MRYFYLSLLLLLSTFSYSQPSVKQMYDEFHQNQANFDSKYLNQTITVTGKISGIHPNNYPIQGVENFHTVNLTATGYDNFIVCRVAMDDKSQLASLNVGEEITVTGAYNKKFSDALILTNVQFSKPKATPTTAKVNTRPAALPLGYYKCYVDHTTNLAMAGYFTVQANNNYVYHGFDPKKRTGIPGTFKYDPSTGKITWLTGAWKNNNYYGTYSLDETYGNRIYLVPNGSDYSACKCFLQ